jgi:hypothetical protein
MPLPKPPQINIIGATSVNNEEEYSYTAEIENYDDFIWIVSNGDIISSDDEKSITIKWYSPEIANSGELCYSYTINGCNSEESCIEVSFINTAVSEYELNKDIIFPNPFNEYLDLSNLKIESKISIFNTSGHLVYRDKKMNRIETINWIPGVYFLRFDTNKGPDAIKIVKL